MAKIFNTTRRVLIAAIDRIVNFPAFASAGFRAGARLILVASNRIRAGFAVQFAPLFVVAQSGIGVAVKHTRVQLQHENWVSTASQSAGGDWESPENSEAEADAVFSELNEGLLLVQGTLIGSFPEQRNRGPLEIEQVVLRCFYGLSEFVLAGSSLVVQYRVGDLGLPVVLDSHTGGVIIVTNVDRTSGFDFDITALGPDGQGAPWTWEDLSDLRIEYQGTILVDAGLATVRVDATRLFIAASHTEVL